MDYRLLPKIDLHRHLEGALRLETLWEFHSREHQTLHGSEAALCAAYTVPPNSAPGLARFLARFDAPRFTFGGAREIERVAAEAVADAALDGVVHLELRFSPVFFARRFRDAPRDLPPALVEDAAEAMVESAQTEAARRGIGISFIVTLGRHFGAAVNRPAAELLARPVAKHLAALDLAGDESHSAREFIPFFESWKAAGKGLTIHAGEDNRIPGAANVAEALDLGATRIGHGVRSILDPGLVARLVREQAVLELCPTSNVQTQACASYQTHPLKKLLSLGVRTTVNTDDPTISQTTLSEEYRYAVEACGLTQSELRECNLNAANAAFLNPEEKAKLVRRLDESWPSAAC